VYWGIGDPKSWPGKYPEVTTTRMVRLTSLKPGVVLEIRKATSSLTNVTTSVVSEDAGKACRVVLKLTELPKEPQQGTITIETNLPGYPKVSVPIYVFVGRRTIDPRLLAPQ
jgi:hypothetical protein